MIEYKRLQKGTIAEFIVDILFFICYCLMQYNCFIADKKINLQFAYFKEELL